jgi:hypothetical protein
MLISVNFQTPIVAEPWEGGTESWSIIKNGPDSRFPVTCEDKGTHIRLSWVSRSPNPVFKGKTCHIKVPLTNISQTFEVVEEKAK